MSLRDACRRSQILNPRVRARPNEHAVNPDILYLLARLQPHILQCEFGRSPVRFFHCTNLRHASCHRRHHPRICPPSHKRTKLSRIDLHDLVERRAFIGRQTPPARHRLIPVRSRRSESAPLHVRDRGLIRRDHPRPCSRLDAHVAQRHAPFHRERPHRRPRVLDHMPRRAVSSNLPDNPQRQILCRHAISKLPPHVHLHRLRLPLRQALRRQHMLHLRRPNSKRQRPKCSVRRGMTVAAHNRHSRLCHPQLRTNHMHDPLIGRIHIKQPNTKLLAIRLQRGNLLRRNQVGDRSSPRLGRNIVIDSRHGASRLPHLPSCRSQSIKRLRRSHLMHQMQIDVDNRRSARRRRNQMCIPNFFE